MAERSEAVEEQAVRDGSAVYSVEPDVATAEDVPHGYKRTEVGVIPEDWELIRLGDLGTFSKGQGIKRDEAMSGEIPCIRYGEIYTHHNDVVRRCSSRISREVANSSKPLKYGDLLFAGSGETKEEIGKAVAFVGEAEAYAGGDIVILSPHEGVPEFLGYLLNAPLITRQKASKGQGDAVVHISASALSSVALPYPAEQEQRAIATALSDADALIESLDRLLAKKRAIKQAAMQQLLTGQTRLPGFTGEWETKRLGEFVSIRNQKVMPSSVHPDTPCIELEHIGQGDGRLLSSSTAKYSTASKYQFRAGDVLFGRLRSYLRKYWLAEQDGICTTEIWPLMVDSSQAASGFLLGIVQTDRFNESASISYGTHMPRADWKVLKNFEVRLPSVNEQTAIANVLSDMDTEIEALERRRNKARQTKQGMMQQLLTGRTRLV
ncbi:restriction endonuclease subunit S [Thioalkalivibrio halophilus]|uniref:Type I restriction modification DNA specificity domain-containing protein n=1 Tax=Thioalkalivibrio halophilus TaxID=252474 RepID=A0A1V2ZVB3_9GAMM|nr:restriction endonuclease subunit S [Thioalkalivibrio halophilus]OOC09082.1 hypothetical protein B1A74_12780 [Thioalkalivibrio halophilus]